MSNNIFFGLAIFALIVAITIYMAIEMEDKQDIRRLKKNIKNVTLIVIVTLLIPIIIKLSMSGYVSSSVNNNKDTYDGWLGFWGSFLGGIIGTLAVIYVAHLQNKKQVDLLIFQIKSQQKMENFNRFINEINIYGRRYAEFNDLQHRNLVYIGNLIIKNNLEELSFKEVELYFLNQNKKIDIENEIYERYSKLSIIHDELSYSYNLLVTYKNLLMPNDNLNFIKPENVLADCYYKMIQDDRMISENEIENITTKYVRNTYYVLDSLKDIQVAAIMLNSEYFDVLTK